MCWPSAPRFATVYRVPKAGGPLSPNSPGPGIGPLRTWTRVRSSGVNISWTPSSAPMDIQARNNVHVTGDSSLTLVLANGFGCDQNMWGRLLVELGDRYRIVRFDYVGSGKADASEYDAAAYATLDGYASDLISVAKYAGGGPRVLIGHSVSAMIGVIAQKRSPGLFHAHVMIGPSPCYINHDGYYGGFEHADIEGLLEALEFNYLGWAAGMAPSIMGAPAQPELSEELSNSFCRVDPDIAARFARATFLGNNISDLPSVTVPVLVLQSKDDLIAPFVVGEHVSRTVPRGTLRVLDNVGHCPHLSVPKACAAEIRAFLSTISSELAGNVE